MSGESWAALVADLLREEEAPGHPDTGLDVASVAVVRRKVQLAAAAVAAGDSARALGPMREAAAVVTDGWPWTSRLAADVLGHAHALERALGSS